MSTQTTSYREVKAVSNSILTEFEKNLRNFKNYWLYDRPFFNASDDALLLGSTLDTMLTRPDEFDEMFYVSTLTEDPAPQMVKFCKNLFNIWQPTQTLNQEQIDELFKKAYEETGFGRDSYEKVRERFKTEGREYFNQLVKGRSKTVISQEMFLRATKIKDDLLSNEFLGEILQTKDEEINGVPIVTVINQLEIYSKYTSEEGGCDIPVKGALDKVHINHNTKTVWPYDIKTSSNIHTFESSYIKYRYFRQAGFYTWLLEKWLIENGWIGYTIMPFSFIVASTTGEGAYEYTPTTEDILMSRHGGLIRSGEYLNGWGTLLNDICWHIKENKWEYPRRVYENDGSIELSIFDVFANNNSSVEY